MVPNLFKNWLLVSKITWRTWEIAETQWKVQKVQIQWATFVQKIHPFRKNILYRGFMYLTFNYLFTKFPNSLCHFWNHKSFFRTQLLCIFLAQTLHTFDKSNPSKCKVSDLLLLALKFFKFLTSFLEPRVSFSLNFASLFSVMRHNFSVIFLLFPFRQKELIKVQIFGTLTARMKFNRIPYAILQAMSQFSFEFCIALHCHDTQFLWNFLAETLNALDKKNPIKVQFFRLLSALVKVHPVSHTIFETARPEFFFEFCKLLCIFLAQTLYTLDKKNQKKRNFQTFEWLG